MLLPSNNTDVELATEDVYCRMQNLVREFISQDVCLTWSDLVDNLSGNFCLHGIEHSMMLNNIAHRAEFTIHAFSSI